MNGIFVNSTPCAPYAELIVNGYKTIETRSKNMLKDLVGQRVAIVRTTRHGNTTVIGYATIYLSSFCSAERFDRFFGQHFVQPTSKYAPNGRGKWFYFLKDAEPCTPFPLPSSAIRHGRSWFEF